MNKRRELERLLPPGYSIGYPIVGGNSVQRSRKLGGQGAHPYVLRPDGKPLRDPNGVPIKVSNTPSDRRARKNELGRIRNALKALGME